MRICKYSVASESRICMECAEVLWTKRAYHKTGGLSTQRAKISGNPHIKSSRVLIRFSSREYSQFSKNLVEIYHHLIKSSRDSHHHSYTLIHSRLSESSRECHICSHIHTYVASRRDTCYHMYIHFEIHIHHA